VNEAEAKTKWCPMVKTAPLLGTPAFWSNRPEPKENQYHCVGSACMLWRWSEKQPAHNQEELEAEAPLKSNGYCGLGGAE